MNMTSKWNKQINQHLWCLFQRANETEIFQRLRILTNLWLPSFWFSLSRAITHCAKAFKRDAVMNEQVTLARGQDFTLLLLLIRALVITFERMFHYIWAYVFCNVFILVGQQVLYVRISYISSAKEEPLTFLGTRPMGLWLAGYCLPIVAKGTCFISKINSLCFQKKNQNQLHPQYTDVDKAHDPRPFCLSFFFPGFLNVYKWEQLKYENTELAE